MIVDIHTHIFPPEIAEKALRKLSRVSGCSPFNDGTLANLTASMQEAGVDLSVIMPVATAPRQVESVNDYAAELNEKYDGKQIISFGAIHPDYANYKKELARLRSLGFRGIKLHPVYQDVNIDDIRFLRILECAAENNLVTLTHAGFDISFPGVDRCSPQMIRHAVEQVGNFPFILAHMGGWEV